MTLKRLSIIILVLFIFECNHKDKYNKIDHIATRDIVIDMINKNQYNRFNDISEILLSKNGNYGIVLIQIAKYVKLSGEKGFYYYCIKNIHNNELINRSLFISERINSLETELYLYYLLNHIDNFNKKNRAYDLIWNFGNKSNTFWVKSNNGLNLMEKPSIVSIKLLTIEYQKFVKIIQKRIKKDTINNVKGYWVKVDYNGMIGYLFDAFLTSDSIEEYEYYTRGLVSYRMANMCCYDGCGPNDDCGESCEGGGDTVREQIGQNYSLTEKPKMFRCEDKKSKFYITINNKKRR